MGVDTEMRASKTFAAWQISDMCLYDMPWDLSLTGLEIRLTFDTFLVVGIRLVATELLKRAVRFPVALGPMCLSGRYSTCHLQRLYCFCRS